MPAQERLPPEVYRRRRVTVAAAAAVLVTAAAIAASSSSAGQQATVTIPAATSTLAPASLAPASVPTTTSAERRDQPPVGVPAVDAAAFAVYDATTQRVIAELNADTPAAVGSLMKLLTAKVVIDDGELERAVTIPALRMHPLESAIGLYEGEQLPRDVLLRAMLVVSANDAARALAVDVGGSEAAFVERMNATAVALGLTNTVASNPVGLDSDTAHSTANDMLRLATLLMEDPIFRGAVAKRSASLHGQTFPATNDLLGVYPGADGVKTGRTTDAGYCLVGSATRDGRRVIVVVLGSSSAAGRVAAASSLLDWAFATTQ